MRFIKQMKVFTYSQAPTLVSTICRICGCGSRTCSFHPLPFPHHSLLRQLSDCCSVMLNIPAGLAPSPGTPLFCISSPKERDTPPIYNEMATPSAEILEQSYRTHHQMTHAMYLSTLVVTKFYELSDRNNRNLSLAFLGAGRFRLDLALGYRERLLSWCVDCHHLLPHVTIL